LDKPQPDTNAQRPFHICPECNAYNAKFNATCWRCNHDMKASAVSPAGVMGFRMAKLDDEAKAKAPKEG
jgi:hypothetical protein